MIHRRPRRLVVRLALCCLIVVAITSTVTAHGGPPASDSMPAHVELVGELQLSGGIHADVWGHKSFAYVGTWSGGCPGTGVRVIDISDPSQPALATILAAHPGTSAEDVVVINARTPAFEGDLLVTGLQRCGRDGVVGAEFWDVTDPYEPRRLGLFATPGTGGVHELHMFQRGGRVFALLTVPHSEAAGAGGDLRIVDATDPARPVQLADWGVFEHLQLQTSESRGQFPDIFGHSPSVSADGNTVYVSYWDAGLMLLDISEPTEPRFIGRTAYAPSDEGNAHSSSVSRDGKLLALADEDIHVSMGAIRMELASGDQETLEALEASFSEPLTRALVRSSEVAYVGRACPAGTLSQGTSADPLLDDPRGKVAVADRGECLFTAKVHRLEEAGALAVVVVNNDSGPPIRMGGQAGTARNAIPAVMVSQSDGERIKASTGDRHVRISLGGDVGSRYNDWGFLRFYNLSDPSNPVQIATFATQNARTHPDLGPRDEGHYSVHNPVIVGNRLYASWFSDGLRVLDITDPTRPRELAAFVPPHHRDPTGGRFNPDRTMVWGVYVHADLVLLSDMNYGLYVVRFVETSS